MKTSWIAALLTSLTLAGTSQAQSQLDWSVHQGELRDAGVYSLAEQRWTRRGAAGASTEGTGGNALMRIYDNSCLWTGAAPGVQTFNGLEACQEVYDDGRIPVSPSNDYRIRQFTFAYMTFAAPGSVDIELSFYNSLGGICAGFTAPTPPQPAAAGSLRMNAASGFTLPGDPTGSGSSWIVTVALDAGNEFCLLADADGTQQGLGDSFNWRFRHFNDTATTGGQRSGPVVAAEPIRGTFGACTFGRDCGFDPQTGPCGTGMSTSDAFWANVDGDPGGPTGTVSTSLVCPNSATGTGCFFFGGWPANAWASYFLELDGSPGCAPVTSYCTAKSTSAGCIPFASATGTPSVSSTLPFRVRSSDHLPSGSGLLIYGLSKSNLDFHGGKLCVRSPLRVNTVKAVKSVPCVDVDGNCTSTTCGMLFQNFNKTIQSGANPLLSSGQNVFTQWIQRDASDPLGFNDNLSDALMFQITP